MFKQTLLVVFIGTLAATASFASVQDILAKDKVLKEADDFCVARIAVLYKAADKNLRQKQPTNYVTLSDALYDLGEGINKGIKFIAGAPRKDLREKLTATLRTECQTKTNDLRSTYLSKFNVVFDDEVAPKKDESLFEEFLDFLIKLLN